MFTALKRFALVVAVTLLPAAASLASTVGALGAADVSWQGISAYDQAGNFYDWQDHVTFDGDSHVQVASGVSAPNGISSTPTITRVFTITNTSLDVFIDWLADIQLSTFASASGDADVLGDFYYDSNTYITAGSLTAFASVNGTYRCSVLDPGSANYDCGGYSAFFTDPMSGSENGTLNPGESVTYTLTAQSFATQRFVAPVPLPPAAALLAWGVIGLGVARRPRSPAQCA